jgi:alpha-tubulin suppressor-like RCC1 family protein
MIRWRARDLSIGLVVFVSLGLPAIGAAQLAEDVEESAKRVIVMVQCSTGEVDLPGAGLLIGMDAERVYVATATHVVSKCAQNDRTRVRFRWSSAPLPARVLNSIPLPLDLAVVAVPRAAAMQGAPISVSLDRLGDPALMRRGDPVYALGNPRGIPWGVSAAPDRFASLEGDVILFASTFIGEGHSGGALLNDRGEIVAMIRGDQGPTGEAISVTRILARVREWKHPIGLRPPLPRLAAGADTTCQTRADGSLTCWGDLGFNQSGGPDIQTLSVPDARYKQVVLGLEHMCGLTFDGAVYCRGSNRSGQLGSGNKTDSYDAFVPVQQSALVFTSIAVGAFHTCALTQQGQPFCWGSGNQGRLGHNSNENSLVPTPIGPGLRFTALAGGFLNTCGLTAEGALFCWGGMHGTGLERLGGTEPPIAFMPERVTSPERFRQVVSGQGHVCALNASGRAFCWGGNESGELGIGRTSEREFTPIAVTGNHTFASIVAGLGGDTCGIMPAGTALCWGPNMSGTHGNGTIKNASSVPVPVSGNLAFASIAIGMHHACGVTADAQIYCWGGAPAFGLGGTASATRSLVPAPLKSLP